MMRFIKKTWTDDELCALNHTELDDLLLDSGTDPNTILRILALLRAQEPEDPADTDRAWQNFQHLYHTPEGYGRTLYPSASAAPRRKRPSPRILAAAATCLAMLMLPAEWSAGISAQLNHWDAQAAEDVHRDLNGDWARYQEELANDRMMRIVSEQ